MLRQPVLVKVSCRVFDALSFLRRYKNVVVTIPANHLA